jgi:hypothetical protein
MDFNELKEYFDTFDKSSIKVPFQLDKCSKILDVNVFISSHIEHLENNRGKKAYLPYYKRLETFYNLTKK